MKFKTPLLEGVLIKRYKRFLADVELKATGKTIVAHVPNSGSMLGVSDPGSPCRVSLSPNPNRKLPHTLEMVKTKEGPWVGVNTALTNSLVHEAFLDGKIKEWRPFAEIKREVKISASSRLDFMLTKGKTRRYVEVKNVSMARPPYAVFPDAVTERGQKHLEDLARLAGQGASAEIFFVVQREDCRLFKPCDDIDPVYGKLLRQVVREKVVVRCWSCKLSDSGISLHQELTVELD